jgi:putative hydrolase of the HAD superfamily
VTRAVLFDVDGVLIHGYHADPARVRAWDATMLVDLGVDPDRFRREFIFDVFAKKVIVGKMALVDALERRLPGLGYRGSPMSFVAYWLTRDSVLNEPLLDIVRTLKERGDCRLFIATNQEHLRASWLWNHLGLSELFEDIFYAARIGDVKPHPRFFRFAEAIMGDQAEPPLFFDDSPSVVEGARKFGWEAVRFDTVDDCRNHPWIAARLA